MLSNIFEIINKRLSDPFVDGFLRPFFPLDVSEAPPFRQYVGAQSHGIDVVVERGVVISVQIYLKPADGFSSYSFPAPFGIDSRMGEGEVRSLLGSPVDGDNTYLLYLTHEGYKFTVDFDEKSEASLLVATSTLDA